MQQQSPPIPRPASPLTIPKAFRRTTGAHGIIASILFADLLGMLLWVLLAAFIWPPIWWLLRAGLYLLHASLVFDVACVLFLCCFAMCLLLLIQRASAWIIPAILMVLILGGVILIGLFNPAWLVIPSPIPAFVPHEVPSWHLLFVPQGAVIAAVLLLLVHVIVIRRTQQEQRAQPLTWSRAHPDDPMTRIVERAYDHFRLKLTRFQPPPLSTLRTPSTFFYYLKHPSPDVQAPPNPEQEMYWHDGNLVLNQEYIGTDDEQAEIFLPLLARLLARSLADIQLGYLFRLATCARRTKLTARLLFLPLAVQSTCEQEWNRQEHERVLDGDWYAYLCGQGPRLRRLLHKQGDARKEQGLPDNAIPSLNERINHLSGLIFQEQQQVQKLRDTLSLPTP